MTEKQQFALVRDYGSFELRNYPAHVLMQVDVEGDFMKAGNIGFGPLINYISGNNLSREKYAMTAPVIQEPVSSERHLVSFVLPNDTDPKDVPVPANSRVSKVEMPESLVGVRKFGGSWNETRFMAEGELLRNAVIQAGFEPVGNLYWARFDPPWKPGFLKKNEALIQLKKVK
ncbi:MAG: SOUL family heme-binding protein [Rhodoluna sp.]